MASITIRNLDEGLKASLRVIAAQHGHSMEEEVRCILRQVLSNASSETGLGSKLLSRFEGLATESFQLPKRQTPRVMDFE